LDVEPDEDSAKIPDVSIVEASAELLYGSCTNVTCSRELDSTRWRKSTKRVSLARVHACIVWVATLSHVGDQTFQDWKQLNYFVPIAMTSTSLQAAVSRVLMAHFLAPHSPISSSRPIENSCPHRSGSSRLRLVLCRRLGHRAA